VYEQERLRWQPVWRGLHGPAPDGVGSEKYDETAAAMIGTVKYGAGLLSIASNGCSRHGVRCPQPAVGNRRARGGRLKSVHGELVNQGAQGSVLHNDDTPAKILELNG